MGQSNYFEKITISKNGQFKEFRKYYETNDLSKESILKKSIHELTISALE